MDLLINENVVAGLIIFLLTTVSGIVVFSVKGLIRLHDVENRQKSTEKSVNSLIEEMKADREETRKESVKLRESLHNLALQIAASNRHRA